jgi:RNA polymerase sigma-70 factor (ECF subfamily)
MHQADANGGDTTGAVSRARAVYDAGRRARSELNIPFEAFNLYFAHHASRALDADDPHAGDMYLACACALGDARALAVLEHTLQKHVTPAVATIDPSDSFVEETLQALRERLLVRRSPQAPRIAEYAGVSSLRSWLCAVAVRVAIDQRRRKSERDHRPLQARDDTRLARGGPELEYLRRRYKGVFEQAVRDAIDQLPARAKLLLRLNVAERMSIDGLGRLYGVGRSTAARWLVSARDELLERVRCVLCATLGLTSCELESLGCDIRSLLDVSLVRLLARGEEAPPAERKGRNPSEGTATDQGAPNAAALEQGATRAR